MNNRLKHNLNRRVKDRARSYDASAATFVRHYVVNVSRTVAVSNKKVQRTN